MKGLPTVITQPSVGKLWPGGSLTPWSAFSTRCRGPWEPLADGHRRWILCLDTHHHGTASKSLFVCLFVFSTPRECVRKCFSSRVASTSTWKSSLMAFTKESCLFLMSGLLWPTTVLWYQVGQSGSRAILVQVRISYYSRAIAQGRAMPGHLSITWSRERHCAAILFPSNWRCWVETGFRW